MKEMLGEIESAAVNDMWDRSLWSGLRELDRHAGGLEPGVLWVVGGWPSMGKTSLMWHFLETICLGGDVPSMLVAKDCLSPEAVFRHVIRRAGVRMLATKEWKPDRFEVEKIRKAAGAMGEARLWLHRTDSVEIGGLCELVKYLKVREGIRLLVIDGFSLIEGEDLPSVLKNLAEELSVTILMTCGMKCGPEDRQEELKGVPFLSDLRHCAGLAEMADKVLLVNRPVCHATSLQERKRLEGKIEIYVRKNTTGECGSLVLKFDESLRTFSGWDYPSWDDDPY